MDNVLPPAKMALSWMEMFVKSVILNVLLVRVQQQHAPHAQLDLAQVEIVSQSVQIINTQV